MGFAVRLLYLVPLGRTGPKEDCKSQVFGEARVRWSVREHSTLADVLMCDTTHVGKLQGPPLHTREHALYARAFMSNT